MTLPPDNAPSVVQQPQSQLPLMTPAQEQLKKNPVTDLVMQSSSVPHGQSPTPYGTGTDAALLGAGVPYGAGPPGAAAGPGTGAPGQ